MHYPWDSMNQTAMSASINENKNEKNPCDQFARPIAPTAFVVRILNMQATSFEFFSCLRKANNFKYDQLYNITT